MSEQAGDRPAATGPLSGLLIIDLTRVLAGPYCSLLLSDLGARFIKVETPDGGDDARGYGPAANDPQAPHLKVAGLPIKMSAYSDATSRPAARTLDADRQHLLAEFANDEA